MKVKLLAVLLGILLWGEVASAQLLFNLDSVAQIGVIGSTATFRGTLENNGETEIHINGDNFICEKAMLRDEKFMVHGPARLAPGSSWSGELFDVRIDTATFRDAAGTKLWGSFTILGGSYEKSQDELATQNFQIQISSESYSQGTP